MLIDISPLKKYSDFRWLYVGQFVSLIGNMISYVAVPYQIYQLTKNNALVGMLGVAQFVPLIFFGLLGGTYADRINRQKLLIVSEASMAGVMLLMVWNAGRENPSVALIFILAAALQGLNGFHRPSMEALNQKMVDREDYASIGALMSFQHALGAIIGPSIGGILIASLGVKSAYLLDALTFFFALFAVLRMSKIATDFSVSKKSPLHDMKVGLQFAISKPELIGTYIIDIVAMLFAFPLALFPAMSDMWGGAEIAGWLFSAMAIGALISTLFSGWANKVRMLGKGVVIAAAIWGIFMIGVGLACKPNWMMYGFLGAFVFLVLAGGADMFSALFRKVIWNETIPNHMRGRLSGIEMISYMSGPLLGNARAGYIASKTSVAFSLTSGGVLCVLGVILTVLLLPKFWKFSRP